RRRGAHGGAGGGRGLGGVRHRPVRLSPVAGPGQQRRRRGGQWPRPHRWQDGDPAGRDAAGGLCQRGAARRGALMRRRLIKLLLAAAGLAGVSGATAAQDCEAGIDCPGIALGGSYTGDWRRNARGGRALGAAYSHLLTLGADWRVDSLSDQTRLSGSASVMYLGGDGISGAYVGDLQGIN